MNSKEPKNCTAKFDFYSSQLKNQSQSFQPQPPTCAFWRGKPLSKSGKKLPRDRFFYPGLKKPACLLKVFLAPQYSASGCRWTRQLPNKTRHNELQVKFHVSCQLLSVNKISSEKISKNQQVFQPWGGPNNTPCGQQSTMVLSPWYSAKAALVWQPHERNGIFLFTLL